MLSNAGLCEDCLCSQKSFDEFSVFLANRMLLLTAYVVGALVTSSYAVSEPYYTDFELIHVNRKRHCIDMYHNVLSCRPGQIISSGYTHRTS